MLKTVFKTGLYSLVLIFMLSPTVGASALGGVDSSKNVLDFDITKLATISGNQTSAEDSPKSDPTIDQKNKLEKAEKVKSEPVKPEVITYTVVSGDSLTKIAQAHQTTWNRLFDQNSQIADQNSINPGDVLTIPTADEVLAPRPVVEAAPVAITYAPIAQGTIRARSTSSVQVQPSPRGSSAGNTYASGYCTWYAKSRRPDLPNRLGNANTWVARAAAQGIATGSAPRAGAIGQQGMHVVYVESVNGDGTVNISEMNYKGFGVVSSRTAPAGNFTYIY